MDAETQQQLAHLTQLRETHYQRLRALELQQAEMGSSCPPHVTTEIDSIRQQLAQIGVDLRRSHVAEARWLARARPPMDGGEYTTGDPLRDDVLALRREIEQTEDSFRREAAALHRAIDYELRDEINRRLGDLRHGLEREISTLQQHMETLRCELARAEQEDGAERRRRQRRTDMFYLGIIGLMVLLIIIVLVR